VKNLLPYYFKIIGFVITLIGIILSVFYLFFDFRFTMPVFAVYSSFIHTKIFATFKTNYADELVLIFLLIGLFFISFSKEKIESENIDSIRYKSLIKSILFNFIFLFISILFVFGTGFIYVLVLNLFSFFIFYLIFFNFYKLKKN